MKNNTEHVLVAPAAETEAQYPTIMNWRPVGTLIGGADFIVTLDNGRQAMLHAKLHEAFEYPVRLALIDRHASVGEFTLADIGIVGVPLELFMHVLHCKIVDLQRELNESIMFSSSPGLAACLITTDRPVSEDMSVLIEMQKVLRDHGEELGQSAETLLLRLGDLSHEYDELYRGGVL